MGRKKRSCIYEYYEYNEGAKTSKCLIEGCLANIKGKHGANLLRHFQHKHKQEYERILECNKENFPTPEPESFRNTKILTKYLVDLVTVHGRPFSLLEDEAFQNIISLIPMVDKTAVTVNRIRELVQERECKLKQPETQRGPWLDNSCEDTSHSDTDTSDSNVSETVPEYPERRKEKKKRRKELKCRACEEFTKDCVDLSEEDRPYLTKNKTSLTMNGLSVEVDFNDNSLKTICRICDSKLQIMFDFIKQVKDAQDLRSSVINNEIEVDKNVKTECESPTPDKELDDIDSNDEMIDRSIRTETAFIKTVIQLKRKPEVTPKSQKRAKVTEDVASENVELVVGLEEESAEMAA